MKHGHFQLKNPENKMIPSKIPDALKNLTQVEEMLISLDFPVMQIHTKPNGGQKVSAE